MLVVPADYTGQKRASVPPLWSFFCLSDVIDSFWSFFKLDYNYITMLCLFLLYNKVNQLYVYIHPFPLEPPSHSTPLGHQRALSWAPHAMQLLPTSSLFYTWECVYVNPILPVCLTLPFLPPRVHMYYFSTATSVFPYGNKFICTIFLDSTYMH